MATMVSNGWRHAVLQPSEWRERSALYRRAAGRGEGDL